ncbi:MAG: phenylpyruvate tautomerase MIF-related protein [Pseudomonadota bacterium]|uniref:L-dopachrome isomerase n=1 Tax=Methylophaga thalassica TaxID=40223 RepID=A0ABQ5TTN0_9GAMM|nr:MULTISPECIES: phenylpyruvate tautomerase MIF-related protein [Methylophaga]MEC9411295.1 phenylpyruvate tautomerase MIF-related protein [Pseudomonadota bacterium]GLP99526.1 phenylpyruvate tautomerase [Methylophaga thalassica]
MPYLNITTNQEVKDKTQFIKKTSETVAKASGKPESYVMIVLNDNANMSFGGSDAPAAMLDYRALGLPGDRQAFSDTLCTLISENLKVEGGRIYISMTDSERQNWGWNHSTF